MKIRFVTNSNLLRLLLLSSLRAIQVDEIAASLMDSDLATRVDKSSAALGRRYARSDEVGVPFLAALGRQIHKQLIANK